MQNKRIDKMNKKWEVYKSELLKNMGNSHLFDESKAYKYFCAGYEVALPKKRAKECYYNDELCIGKVNKVNSRHNYLCEKCEKELNSIKD